MLFRRPPCIDLSGSHGDRIEFVVQVLFCRFDNLLAFLRVKIDFQKFSQPAFSDSPCPLLTLSLDFPRIY